MIYLVSREHALFKSDKYEELSPEDAIKMLKQEKILGADTETEGLCPVSKKLLSIQLGNEEFQIVWDCVSYPITMLKEVLEDPNILFIWHNYSFDSQWLLQAGIVQPNYFDTMIGERVLNNGKDRSSYSVSLKACALKYCNYDMDKTARGEIITKGLTERTIVYSATDVKYSIPIYKAQQKELIKYHVRKAAQFESKFTIVVGYIKLCGVKLDVDRWKAKMKKDEAKRNKYLKLLNDWTVNYYKEHNGSKGYIEYTTIVDTQFIHRGDNNIPKDLASLNIDVESKYHLSPSSGTFKQVNSDKYGFIVYGTYKIPFGYTLRNKFNPFIEHVNAIQLDMFAPVQESFGDKCVINWSSSTQVVPLFELLGFNCDTVDKTTKMPKKSADMKLIKPQRELYPEFVDAYIGYKEATKICDAFGQNYLSAVNKVDGRIHADFNPIGADTFRMSCGGTKGGVNLQQLPSDAETRACFVSEKGNKWISVDYQSQESRLIASVTGDRSMIHIYDEGECGDMHSLVAYMAYPNIIPRDTPIKDIKKKYHNARQDAKKVEFAVNYGGNDNTLVRNNGLDPKEAKEIYDNYMKGFPGMKDYQDYCRKDVMERGYIQMNNITGAKCFAHDWDQLSKIKEEMTDHSFWKLFRDDPFLMDDFKYYKKRQEELGKQSINYRIQNRGACCFKLASMMFFNWIVKHKLLGIVKICIPVHDETNAEAPDNIADTVAKVLLKAMEEGAKPFCDKLPLPGDLALDKDGKLPTYWIH